MRVSQVCKKYGLFLGEAMDLSTGWDFNRGEDRRQAVKHIKQEKPMVVIGSPPCTFFSAWNQGINHHKMDPARVVELRKKR